MAALSITKDNFETEVLNSDKPVLVDFWAAWCGPCRMLSPVVEKISDEVSDVKFCKVNIDEEPELAAEYNIMNIPTLLLFKAGKAGAASVGVKTKDEIKEFIHSNVHKTE